MSSDRPPPSGTPLRSELAGDPEMKELLEQFVSEMPSRIAELASAWSEERREQLRILAHRLKGSGASYGYPSVGQAAGALESGLKDAERDLESLRSEFDALVDLCSRAAV